MTTSRQTFRLARRTQPSATPLSATLERELAQAVKQVKSTAFWDRFIAPERRRTTMLVAAGVVAAAGLTVGTIQFLRYRGTKRAIQIEAETIADLEEAAVKELITEFAELTP